MPNFANVSSAYSFDNGLGKYLYCKSEPVEYYFYAVPPSLEDLA